MSYFSPALATFIFSLYASSGFAFEQEISTDQVASQHIERYHEILNALTTTTDSYTKILLDERDGLDEISNRGDSACPIVSTALIGGFTFSFYILGAKFFLNYLGGIGICPSSYEHPNCRDVASVSVCLAGYFLRRRIISMTGTCARAMEKFMKERDSEKLIAQFTAIKARLEIKHSRELERFDELVAYLAEKHDTLSSLPDKQRRQLFALASSSGNFPLMVAVLDIDKNDEKSVHDFLCERMNDDRCALCFAEWSDVSEFGRLGQLTMHTCKKIYHELCVAVVAKGKCPLCKTAQGWMPLHEIWNLP